MNDQQEHLARLDALYSQLASCLYDAMDPQYVHTWQKLTLHVERIGDGVPFKFSFAGNVVLKDGVTCPMLARPDAIAVTDRIDELNHEHSRMRFSELDFQLVRVEGGVPYFEVFFKYPEYTH